MFSRFTQALDLRPRRAGAAGEAHKKSRYVLAPFLLKLAKHLALLACLTIAGRATGRLAASEAAILLLILAAVALHTVGRRLSITAAVRHDRRAP